MSTTSGLSTFTGHALARVGLLGNPSDGYGGRVIAMTLNDFAVAVTITPAAEWSFDEAVLAPATVSRVRTTHPALFVEPAAVSMMSSVPRQVGLSGSSAIIIALLRALAHRVGYTWDPVDLARTALDVETSELGWAAGPQDRVVQSYEGLLDMDFAEPWQATRYTTLDAALLPPLFVAWNWSTGAPSDIAHSSVRDRWERGDAQVISTMKEFADLAAAGRAALDAGLAAQEWPALMNTAFSLRQRIWEITSVDTALVQTGQQFGAGVAFAGSGGAVVGSVEDPAQLGELAVAYDELGAGFKVLAR